MRHRAAGVGVLIQLALITCAAWPALAAAASVSGPHETVESVYTTTQPNAPAGFHYTGRYHAAGDPAGDPPYMRRMMSHSPPGTRFDTSVPERCTASDFELALRGADACPAGSRLGGGTVYGNFMGFRSALETDVFNNAGEQIFVSRSPEFASITRGKVTPDGTTEFAAPTCFPTFDPPGCPVDTALQLGSDISMQPYTRASNGVVRSYLTTAPTCPVSGHWETPITFWWADGSVDTVVTQQPCTGAAQNRGQVASTSFRLRARLQARRLRGRAARLTASITGPARHRIRVTLRRGGRLVARSLVRLDRAGRAQARFNVRLGGLYRVIAQALGSANLRAESNSLRLRLR